MREENQVVYVCSYCDEHFLTSEECREHEDVCSRQSGDVRRVDFYPNKYLSGLSPFLSSIVPSRYYNITHTDKAMDYDADRFVAYSYDLSEEKEKELKCILVRHVHNMIINDLINARNVLDRIKLKEVKFSEFLEQLKTD